MKTTLDLIDTVYPVLKGSALEVEITGAVYKNKRPVNSKKEDVVVNVLPITAAQLQNAIVNVNVFVPDVDVSIEGVQQKMPNNARLKQLARLAVDLLEDGISGDYTWSVQQQTLIEDEGNAQHFINIRIEFFISNIN